MVISNEFKKHVLAEARKTLAQKPERYVESQRVSAYKPPEPEPEPEYVPGLDTVPSAMTDAWVRYIDARIEEKVETRCAAERAFMFASIEELLSKVLNEAQDDICEVTAKALDDLHDENNAARRKDLDEFRAHIVRLEAVCNRLHDAFHSERGKTLDMPNPLSRLRSVN